ncbi:MAG: helix-turn-helix domain-containing protein [Piscinibacter sp.]|uniref:helix-turn-helix domain-containing protein n=1 Tax=Piscinibacter sp. TaxID=1903157 RepID=UPI003D0C539D
MDYPIQTPLQLATHLRSLRKARGLSQADLGARLGVGQTRIARIEGNPTAISVEQLIELLGALGVRLVLRDTRGPQPDNATASKPLQGSTRQRKTGGEW